MKKLKTFAAFLLTLICMFSTLIVGCSSKIAAPSDFQVNEDNILYWEEIENARSYVIEVTAISTGEVTEATSRKTSYSLSKLEEGDYDIRIKAVATGANYDDSDWSEVLAFHKDYETGCVYKLFNSAEYQIIKVGTASGAVYIEDLYRGKPVTTIAANAFKGNNKVTHIELGNNVKTIGERAFYNCTKLESIDLKSVTTIGPAAFQGCKALKQVSLPETITEISEFSFAYCSVLETVEIKGDVTTINDSAFYCCNVLNSVEIPDSVTYIGPYAFASNSEGSIASIKIGSMVETIDEGAFSKQSKLTKVEFAEDSSLKTIDEYAFQDCSSLGSITLPDGVESIGVEAFINCSNLAEVNIPDSVTQIGSFAFNATKLHVDQVNAGEKLIYADDWLVECIPSEKAVMTKVEYDTIKEGTVGIADQVFLLCPELTTVELRESVKYIGNYAFAYASKLYKVSILENSVEVIGDRAFEGCEVLYNVVLGNGIKTIGNYAFKDCARLANNSLGNSIIPESVEMVGSRAFIGTLLWDNPTDEGIIYAGDWVVGFSQNVPRSSITLNENTAGIAKYAFYIDSKTAASFRTVNGLGNVQYIGAGAFENCVNLTSVTLHRNLKRIENSTFSNCASLFEIDFPSRLQIIDDYAFNGCVALNEVDLSECDSLTKIGYRAFSNDVNIESIVLPEGLETIDEYAFNGCESLTEVSIPNSVTSLGANAFRKCFALESVTLGDGLADVADYTFFECTALKNVTFGSNIKTIGRYAFAKCAAIENLTLPEGIKALSDYAFYKATGLKTLTLPSTLETINSYAFSYCQSLDGVVIPNNITYVGAHAFYKCSNATFYLQGTGEEWHYRWNSTYRPIVNGVTLSDDATYVASVTVNENTLLYFNDTTIGENGEGINAPIRDGYTFIGWASTSNATTAEYTAAQLVNVPAGTTVYSIWTQNTI